MKTTVKFFFNGKEVPGREQAVLEPAGCGPDVIDVSDNEVLRQVFVYVTLDDDDPRATVLRSLLEQHSVPRHPQNHARLPRRGRHRVRMDPHSRRGHLT